MSDKVTQAIKILKQGGIIIFPTDTAFGIGCRMDNIESVVRLFKIRQRPPLMAVPVLVSGTQMAQKYWLSPLPSIVRHYIETYWPGGLTVIYHAQTTIIPTSVRGGGTTIGLRQPDHQLTIKLIEELQVPLLGTSANFHGLPTPYVYSDLDPQLVSKVDYVLSGSCKYRTPSTVVDCTSIPCQIIRQGIVRLNKVEI